MTHAAKLPEVRSAVTRRPENWTDPIPQAQVWIQTTERYLGCKQQIQYAPNDRIVIEPAAGRLPGMN